MPGETRAPANALPPTRRHAACTIRASAPRSSPPLASLSQQIAASHAALVSNGTRPPHPPHTNDSQTPWRHSYRGSAARQWPAMPHSAQRSRPTRLSAAAKTSVVVVAAARVAAVARSRTVASPALTPPREDHRGPRCAAMVRNTGTATHSKQRGKMVLRRRK
ncbi:hypothetical protein I4F81_004675 [Pyropia yezoensis]|uniref:Uncharacterized protein n=1 Tax=Pyropia yezoensis TaxID=2788 RepID=A0ACC3BVR1_PYRYE|nr:hypothetical protein I4F81_004675 [Neopyropia yezoensis]